MQMQTFIILKVWKKLMQIATQAIADSVHTAPLSLSITRSQPTCFSSQVGNLATSLPVRFPNPLAFQVREPDYLSSNSLTGTATAATVIFGRAQINMCVAIWPLFTQYLTFVVCIVWFWCCKSCKSCKSWMPISLQQMLSPKSSWARL